MANGRAAASATSRKFMLVLGSQTSVRSIEPDRDPDFSIEHDLFRTRHHPGIMSEGKLFGIMLQRP
jgi:hypothetical protein